MTASPLSVLIVDDEQLARDELCFLAASVNFEVIVQPKIKAGS